MNKDRAKGQWDLIKGGAKKAWGDLTEDDFRKAEASEDKFHGAIQKRFVKTRSRKEERMLLTISSLLFLLWVLGLATAHTMGGLIHILIMIAVVGALVRIVQGHRGSPRRLSRGELPIDGLEIAGRE